MSYIEIKDLMKDYISGDIITKVLKKINLEIKKSDFMALAGASGSGKTTLLNLIGGLDSCTAGEIIFDGSDLTKMSKSELCTFRRNNLGFVFQSYNLIPVLTAYENVEYPLILKKYFTLIEHLCSFNDIRIDITHKILMKYKKISELERDSERVTKIGNLIIRDLNKSVHELADDFKRLSIETFKYVKEK